VFTRLEFRDFRGFAHLELPGLQRVNLICGQNNCGKTSLLEGIEMLCDYRRLNALANSSSLRPDADGHPARRTRWWVRDASKSSARLAAATTDDLNRSIHLANPTQGAAFPKGIGAQFSAGVVDVGQENDRSPSISCQTVSAHHRESSEVIALFDRAVSRRGGEERIEHLLRLVDPRIRKLRARTPTGEDPFLEVDLQLSERIPLSQTGQGLIRMVGIFSLLLGDAPKVLLIDEIENGLHHSLLPQIWRGIAAAAKEFDVQVFATTHSRECIEAAHAVFEPDADYGFAVIQLFRSDTDRNLEVQGRVLDRRLIAAAMTGDVDLR
jgi:hypothetical protein